MYASAIIFFREILEIAIILTVIMAAARGVKGRNLWVGIGLIGGLIGSLLVAFFTDTIADLMDGMGQEIFNAMILYVAVAMISWTVIWMSQHARKVVANIKHVAGKVQEGELPLTALAVVISLCVWREGSEIALFMYGIASTTDEPVINLFLGSLAGGSAAAIIGLGIYFGLIKLSVKHFFRVTEWLLILLACGLAMQATGYLVAADVLPAIVYQMWDSSHILSQDSLAGQVLHALVGYSARPSAMQLIAYGITLAGILSIMQLVKTKNMPKLQTQAAS